jgi:hypothetical protein
MSEISLLGFGCAVTFIALAAVYVYLRESTLARDRASDLRLEDSARQAVREVV